MGASMHFSLVYVGEVVGVMVLRDKWLVVILIAGLVETRVEVRLVAHLSLRVEVGMVLGS